MTGINYLFPPEEISNLPKWRFYLHFIAPDAFTMEMLNDAREKLRCAEFSIVQFPLGFDEIRYEKVDNSVSIPFFVSDEDRLKNNSLELYEADVWKIIGNMATAGFQSEIYYEAIDWKE